MRLFLIFLIFVLYVGVVIPAQLAEAQKSASASAKKINEQSVVCFANFLTELKELCSFFGKMS